MQTFQRLEVVPPPLDLHCERLVAYPGDSHIAHEKLKAQGKPNQTKLRGFGPRATAAGWRS
jgi:hypothetical protein